jgi:tetratricopeptide (TPR) repeat protein
MIFFPQSTHANGKLTDAVYRRLTYLQARQKLHYRNIENLLEAKKLFEETIRLDANYDPGYSGLARTISLFPTYSNNYSGKDVIIPAKAEATKALNLNPKNAEAYSVIGYVAYNYEWDWETAEAAFKKSIEIVDDDAELYNFIGDYYQTVMHPFLTIEMESKALELDPLNPTYHFDLSRAYALFGDWENALRFAKSAQSLGGLSGLKTGNGIVIITSYSKLGQMDKAEDVLKDEWYISDSLRSLVLKIHLAIANGDSNTAEAQIKQLINITFNSYAIYGKLYLSVGNLEKAAYWFEKAIENHDPNIIGGPVTYGLTIPEYLPENQLLRQTLDVPELNKLFDIRKKNLQIYEAYISD